MFALVEKGCDWFIYDWFVLGEKDYDWFIRKVCTWRKRIWLIQLEIEENGYVPGSQRAVESRSIKSSDIASPKSGSPDLAKREQTAKIPGSSEIKLWIFQLL